MKVARLLSERAGYFGVVLVEPLLLLELPELELPPLPELWLAEAPPLERLPPELPLELPPELRPPLEPELAGELLPPEPEGALWTALPPLLPEPLLPPLQPELEREEPAPEEPELCTKVSRGISRRGSGTLPPSAAGVESAAGEDALESELLPAHL